MAQTNNDDGVEFQGHNALKSARDGFFWDRDQATASAAVKQAAQQAAHQIINQSE